MLPPNINIVGSRWTHICKQNQERTVRAKSWVVAQGFTQMFGVNYDKTYAPVSQLASLQTICAIAVQNNWPIHQIDVYNAYVNADLEEPRYMWQPPGYIEENDQHILKLKKAMYGLKESGRAWYKCLSATMNKMGFTKSRSDAAVFYRHNGKGLWS